MLLLPQLDVDHYDVINGASLPDEIASRRRRRRRRRHSRSSSTRVSGS